MQRRLIKIFSYGKIYCLSEFKRDDYEQPNFMGTGLALVGLMNDSETDEEFWIRKNNIHLKNDAINTQTSINNIKRRKK